MPFDQQRVDHVAAIIDGDVAHKLDVAGFGIQFDDANMRAERVGEITGFEERGGFEAWLHIRRQSLGYVGRGNRLPEGDGFFR